MIGRLGADAARWAVLAPVVLAACSPAPRPQMAAATPVPAPVPVMRPAKPHVFTLDTPVDHIVADPRGKAVLDRDLPVLMADKHYPLFEDMSLSEIAMFSHGKLTKRKLALVKSDLIQISYLAPEPGSPEAIAPAQ